MFHFKLCFDNNPLRLAMKYSNNIHDIQKRSNGGFCVNTLCLKIKNLAFNKKQFNNEVLLCGIQRNPNSLLKLLRLMLRLK